MTDRLMGWENEYAFTAFGPGGEVLERGAVLNELSTLAQRAFAHMRALNGNGIFLGSGARFYVDCGCHPEFCTPECVNPWDVVRYLLAGEQILTQLLAALVETKTVGSGWFYRCNVDYSGNGATWGAHESVMHCAVPRKLADDLLPFLVSRIVYTGAGGFDATNRAGCIFTISPRAHYFRHAVSDNSTGDRGVYHTKNETLASEGYNRLHILGESLNSHTANWLKAATLALCVRLAEAGLNPGRGVGLVAPVAAMHAIATDPTCKARVAGADGRDLNALQIQRHYLECARRHVNATFMPAWAPRAIEEWAAMLERLEGAPDSVATCLDWAIKYQIFQRRLEKRGFTWQMLRHWSTTFDLLHKCLEVSSGSRMRIPASFHSFLAAKGPLHDILQQLTPCLSQRGLQSSQLDDFLRLRLELFEIDMRFGQLGTQGIFSTLDRGGVLQHRFPGIDNIEDAMVSPPAVGRAKIRGEFIRRVSGGKPRYSCDWTNIYDQDEDRILDLRDPWTNCEKWRDRSSSDMVPDSLHEMMRDQSGRRRSRQRAGEGGAPF